MDEIHRATREVIENIACSAKYSAVCSATIESVVNLEARRLGKDAPARRLASAARKRMHRIAAFYLGERSYREAGEALLGAAPGDLEGVCLDILGAHASSRERIPIMRELYRWVFDAIGVPAAVMDLACAYNPLAWRWMNLPRTTCYRAFDINERTVDIVRTYFRVEKITGEAVLKDVVCSPVEVPAEVAFLMKMYHCLEHRERGIAWKVVLQAPAAWVVVTFPTRNLASRRADIAANYLDEIRSGCAEAGYSQREAAFDTEHVVLIGKGVAG